jgi:CRP-like cAMP-binding protein
MEALGSIALWKNSSPSALRALAHSCDYAVVLPVRVLLRAGQLPDTLYMLLEGEVEEVKGASPPGRLGPGSAIDVVSMFLNVRVQATYRCISMCTVLAMSAAQYRTIAGHRWLTATMTAQRPALANPVRGENVRWT